MTGEKIDDVERGAESPGMSIPTQRSVQSSQLDPDSINSSTPSDPFSNAHAIDPSSTSLPQSHADSLRGSRGKLFSECHDHSEYTIEELAPYDDEDMVRSWQRKLILYHPIVTICVFLSYGAYYGYRIWCNYQYRLKYGGLADGSWIFIGAEGICIAPYFFWMALLMMSPEERKRPKLRLRGDVLPAVDVLLTTCGEVVPMISNTVRAACNIDYPRDRYRIIICDDAADPELEEAVRPLTLEHPQLFYQARNQIPGVPHHYKAGNLQSGIDFAVALPGGPGEYLATLDADMIPDPQWLRAMLPHLIRDPKMGMISPPQTFYNAPLDDPLCQTINEFIHFLEVKKDGMRAAWCTGSGVVFKRFLVDDMGGWPTPSMAEDQLLSSMMNGRGYQTAYLHEFMQCGMVPESIISHLKQRTRWAVGTLETAQELNWGLPGKFGPRQFRQPFAQSASLPWQGGAGIEATRYFAAPGPPSWLPCGTRNMTFRQRWCVFTFAFNTMMTIPIFVCYFIIPALLYWGRDLMVYSTLHQLRWQLRLCAIWVCFLRLNDVVVSLPSGYIQAQRCSMAYQFMVPYLAVSIIRCYILPTWLGGKKIAFLASGAIRDRLKERYPKLRAGLWTRLRLMGWNCRVYTHAIFVAFCFGAAGIDWYRAAKIHKETHHIVRALRHLLVNSMLPPIWWLMLALAYLIPVVYVFFPPSVPDREELLQFDPKTGVGYPKRKEIKQVWGVLPLVREILWGLTVIYCIVLFIGTFIY